MSSSSSSSSSSSHSTDQRMMMMKRQRRRYTVVTVMLLFAAVVAVLNLIKGAFLDSATATTRFMLLSTSSSSSFPALNVPLAEKWNCAFSKSTTTASSSSLLLKSPKSVKFPPISCQDAMTFDRNNNNVKKRSSTTNTAAAAAVTSDPNKGRLHGRYTTTHPPFWISLHNAEFDSTRWAIMEHGFYYERLQSEAFVEIMTTTKDASSSSSSSASDTSTTLNQDDDGDENNESNHHNHNDDDDRPPLHVVDVGGNIGWFTLQSIAAALSVNRSIVVDVFEPNPRNRLRLCESLHLNQWLHLHDKVAVNIYPVGVSSQSGGSVPMSISESGTGKLGVVVTNNAAPNQAAAAAAEVVTVPLVALDDLADELNWYGCDILKVDVEGLEMEVFLGAKRFLATGRVRNIFFEGNTRDETETKKFRNIVQLLLGESGTTYHAYKHGMWMGPSDLVPLTAMTDQLFALRNNHNDNHNNNNDMNDGADASTKDQVIRNYTDSLYSLCRGPENKTDQCNFWFRPPSSFRQSA